MTIGKSYPIYVTKYQLALGKNVKLETSVIDKLGWSQGYK